MEPRKFQFYNSTLTIVFGDILTSKAEVIVSSDDTGISMGAGISGCIRKAGGDCIREDAQKKLPAQLGDVVVSTAGAMEQKYIFHCLTIDHENKDFVSNGEMSEQEEIKSIIWNTIKKCFRLMEVLELKSIAFPSIGIETAHNSLKDAVKTMVDAILFHVKKKRIQCDIEIYVNNSIAIEESACQEIVNDIDSNIKFRYRNNRMIGFPGASSQEEQTNSYNIEKETYYDTELFCNLTIDGTEYEDVEVKVADPNVSIRDQIKNIVQVFDLPKTDHGGYPIQYLLCQMVEDEEEPMILGFEDEDGREQCLMDYNVQPDDNLRLISLPISGGYDPMKTTCLPKRKGFIERIFSKKANEVFSSVFAPHQVRKGSGMMIQVYLYKDEERDEVCNNATKCDERSSERAYSPLNFKLQRGAFVDVMIRMQGIEIERPHKIIVWQGCYTSANFYVEIPEHYSKEKVWGEVFLSVEGALLGELDFLTEITSNDPDQRETAPVSSRQFKKIFISYAHQDETKVQYIARAYEAQGVDYFFDRDYLKPGDIFPLKIKEFIYSADLFILCWSANAAQSEYVDLERKLALERAYPKVKPFEKAPLSIYPMSIEPQAELPADMRSTYNFIEMQRKTINAQKEEYVI